MKIMIGPILLVLGSLFYYLNQKNSVIQHELLLTKQELTDVRQKLDELVQAKKQEEFNTGYNILDIMSAGCRGVLTVKSETIKLDKVELAPEIKSFEEVVVSSFNAGKNTIVFKNIKSAVEGDLLDHVRLGRQDIRELPLVIIGKKFDVSYERSGGTVDNDKMNFHYQVDMNAHKQLVVHFTHSFDRVFNFRPIRNILHLSINCVGSTLDEIDLLIEKNIKR